MLTWPIIRGGLSYILGGRLYIKNGHLPPADHAIPEDFIGICVTSADDPAMDDYVISQLRALAIRQVRLDFSYDDLDGFNARFLKRLINENFQITLHLLQPFTSARKMEGKTEQLRWQEFITQVLDRYGQHVARIEIGSTINRKRWAGYTVNGFLQAWNIAFQRIKARGMTLAGPNVTDFEPIYNVGILKLLKRKNQLPDIHTNNLFSERVSEPERFDHRIFKYRWATAFKFNLVRKARLLKKISSDFGIRHFISPVAFWAIYRIERLLPDGAQKQADYAARYMMLNAASGALDQVYWGAMICHREGLIDDGLKDAEYPALERVTHYASVNGEISNFKYQPSFYAMQTAAKLIQGTHYCKAITSAQGLEIHHFKSTTHHLHVLWTINGKAALLNSIYHSADLAAAQVLHRDGHCMNTAPALVTECPIYLLWPLERSIPTKPNPALAKDLAIHAHIQNLQYYPYQQHGWFGMILAASADEAALIAEQLNPQHLASPQKNSALRHARNAIWALPDPRDAAKQITVKQPVKMYPHKQLFDRFKPSKAKRSWNGAVELLRRGIATAMPIAFFEKTGDSSLKQNFYICDYVRTDSTIGEMFRHFAQGNKDFVFVDKNITITAEETYQQLANFLLKMHKNGTFFRDLSGGNILVQVSEQRQLGFSLIDTARARFYNRPTPISERIADMARICNKLHWAGRERFMGLYMAGIGRKMTTAIRLKFHLYDFKVNFKRKYGRKGIKRLLKSIKGTKNSQE